MNASGNSANAVPGSASVSTEGTTSFGAVNNTGGGTTTATLTFNSVTFPVTTGNYLSLRLASFQTNNNGGMDNATTNNGVTVSVAYNGSPTFVPTLQVNGLSTGSIFNYNATGVATTPAPINTTNPTLTTVNSPNDRTGGGSQQTITGTAGYSTIRLNFGANITQIQVQIRLVANGKTGLFIDDLRIGSSGPLPVELKSFDATARKNAVLLKWITASEANNAAFDIQRSHNAVSFETVARVAGRGTITQNHYYEWLDSHPLAEVSYCRLRQLDYNGNETFSPIVAVASEHKVALYPVPARTTLAIERPTTNAHYRVLNMLGNVVLVGSLSAINNEINVASLSAGLYQMEVTSSTKRIVSKFTKVD